MGKRKAEGPPVVELEPETFTPTISLAEEVYTPVQGLTTVPTAKEEGHQETTPDGHLAATQSEVEGDTGPEDNLFWALLALIGYETW